MHGDYGSAARKAGLGWGQMQREATQRAVADMHADHGATGQQKGQYIAQVELVVDAGNQEHQQGDAQHPAGAGRQDVDVALGQRRAVGRLEAAGPEAMDVGSHMPQRVQQRMG